MFVFMFVKKRYIFHRERIYNEHQNPYDNNCYITINLMQGNDRYKRSCFADEVALNFLQWSCDILILLALIRK